jgi:hypothetical protein
MEEPTKNAPPSDPRPEARGIRSRRSRGLLLALAGVVVAGGVATALLLYRTDPAPPSRSTIWSKVFGGAAQDAPNAVALAPDGDILVTGSYGCPAASTGSIDFGGGPLPAPRDCDVFVARLGADGAHRWSKGFGSDGRDEGIAVGSDAQGDVYVAGTYAGTIDLGGGPLPPATGLCLDGLEPYACPNVFLAKFDPRGGHLWSKGFGGDDHDDVSAVAVTPGGDVQIVGSYGSDGIDFGGGPLVADVADAFVAKFGPDGRHLWSKRFGGAAYQSADAMALGADGSLYVAGKLGAGPAGPSGTAGSAYSVVLARLDAGGRILGWTAYEKTQEASVGAAAARPAGGVCLAGTYLGGGVDFGGRPFPPHDTTRDTFVACVDAEGRHVWSQGFGCGWGDEQVGVAVDARGTTWVAGYFCAERLAADASAFASVGSAGAFLAVFDANGVAAGRIGSGPGGTSRGRAVAVVPDGGIVAAGTAGDLLVGFAGTEIAETGLADVFVTRLAP